MDGTAPRESARRRPDDDPLAYVIYTSGSTGQTEGGRRGARFDLPPHPLARLRDARAA